MNYRNVKVLAEKTLSGAGTEVIDLNIKDIISRITLAWRIRKAGAGMQGFPYEDVIKIELVDGSDVLHGLTGAENQALCIYDRKCPSMNHGSAMPDSSQYSTYGIDFGRFLYDPLLAFDPTRFRNPQLRITYDVDVSDTGVTSGYLEIWANVFDEKVPSPIGFLMSKEHWAGAKPTSGYEYIDLPTDHPIRKLLLRAYVKGAEPWYQIDQARIDEDNEKRIPFDWDSLEDYHRVMKGTWTPVSEILIGQAYTTGSHYYVTPTDYFSVPALCEHTAPVVYMSGNGTGGDLHMYSSSGVNVFFSAIVRGYLPNHCFEFPFGLQDDPEDWYDVTKLGSCRLRLHAGTGGATATGVVLQQLRRY